MARAMNASGLVETGVQNAVKTINSSNFLYDLSHRKSSLSARLISMIQNGIQKVNDK
jgi:hypothetical protein